MSKADPPVQSNNHGLNSLLEQLRAVVHISHDEKGIYQVCTELVLHLAEVESCCIFLIREHDRSKKNLTLVAQSGKEPIARPINLHFGIKNSEEISLTGENSSLKYFHKPIEQNGEIVGYLSISCFVVPAVESQLFLDEATRHLSNIYKQEEIQSQLRNYAERLEAVTSIQRLILQEASIQRISTALARETAFRLSADITLILLREDSNEYVKVTGVYGIPTSRLPKRISRVNTLPGKALRLGGIMSVPQLSSRQHHGLDCLSEFKINCVHLCSIDIGDNALGLIITGYRRERLLDPMQTSLIQDIAQSASVAIASAQKQERLTLYANRLQDLVDERTEQLQFQTARAEEANQAKSRFVANMSHELRTPLTAVIGYASVLADGVFGAINEKQIEALQSISKSGEHLKQLIDEVLNLSRIEAGKEDPEPSRIELFPLIKQIYKLMLQSAVSKEIKLSSTTPTDKYESLQLYVDPRHIRQILINLVSNAIKYTEPGGTVVLYAEIIGDMAKICVKDSGVGIPESVLPKLFERYERGENEYSLAQTGTGIGLALTKHLVEINGGQIGAYSQFGEGSEFWVLVPLIDSSLVTVSSDEDHGQHISSDAISGLNVLIVDDNQTTCEVLSTIVTRAGATALSANTVQAARTILRENSVDICLIDLAIPHESGLELIKYIRGSEHSGIGKIPLIVVSACVFNNDKEASLIAGADFFIAKPFQTHEIISAIRHYTTMTALN
ncbi:MAG: ATP-binding protein [bacterium]|nr:ATP-binding protein [bacterium]